MGTQLVFVPTMSPRRWAGKNGTFYFSMPDQPSSKQEPLPRIQPPHPGPWIGRRAYLGSSCRTSSNRPTPSRLLLLAVSPIRHFATRLPSALRLDSTQLIEVRLEESSPKSGS